MKQYLLFAPIAFLILMGTSQQVQAQYQQGDVLINGGLSVGLLGYNWSGYNRVGAVPAITANVEYSLDNRIAVGPYIGYFGRNYRWKATGKSHQHRFSAFAFGARGTVHATELVNDWFNIMIDENILDLYGSAQLGYEVYSWNYDDDLNPDFYPRSSGNLNLGLIIGARYTINQKLSGYLELGRGTFSLATFGLTFRL